MLNKTINISLIKADMSFKIDVSVSLYVNEFSKCVIELLIDSRIKDTFVGDDFFDALCRLREGVYNWKEYYPAIFGALVNVYPSRMSRQMSKGVKAYFLTPGKQASNEDMVEVFNDVHASQYHNLATVEMQQGFYIDWLKSL